MILIFAGTVAAQSPVPRFAELDIDRDGRISYAEWNGPRVTFDRLDINHNGFISRGEFKQEAQLARAERQAKAAEKAAEKAAAKAARRAEREAAKQQKRKQPAAPRKP